MQNDRDNPLWLQLWQDNDTDFHQTSVNPLLIKFWPEFDLNPNSRVFIPLCGKSLDILWLAQQGHQVIGVELSAIAVKSFFSENKLTPTKKRQGKFTVWRHKNITIFCGDFFSLKPTDLGHIDSVFDRAALTALPQVLRQPYVEHLGKITPKQSDIFLLTTEDIEHIAGGDNTPKVDNEIAQLYSLNFTVCLKHTEHIVDDENDNTTQAHFRLYQLLHKSNFPDEKT